MKHYCLLIYTFLAIIKQSSAFLTDGGIKISFQRQHKNENKSTFFPSHHSTIENTIRLNAQKGFGKKSNQPSLQEVVSKFQNRIPENNQEISCPCGSTKSYKDCCGLIHSGERKAASPAELLQSRYTAFSWRMIEYIIETTHRSSRDFQKDKVKWAKELNREGMFDSFEFVSLNYNSETISEDGKDGSIEFSATMKAKESSESYESGQTIVIREKSRFVCENGVWFYSGGEVRTDYAGLDDVVLN